MVDISSRSDREQRDHTRAFDSCENIRERECVICRRLKTTDGVLVKREVDVRGEWLTLVGFEQHDRQFRIDRPRSPGDVRIQLPRVPSDGPILHKKAPVEADSLLSAPAKGHARRHQFGFSGPDTFGNFVGQFGAVAPGGFEIASVRGRACTAVWDQRTRMAVGGADHDVAPRYSGGAVNHFTRFLNDRGWYADEIARYEREPLAARRDHYRLRMQIIMGPCGKAGCVVTRHRSTRGRTNRDLGGSDTKPLSRDHGSGAYQDQQSSHKVIVAQKSSQASGDVRSRSSQIAPI